MFTSRFELYLLINGQWVLETSERDLRRLSVLKGRKLTSAVVDGVRIVKVSQRLLGGQSSRIIEERLKRGSSGHSTVPLGRIDRAPPCEAVADLTAFDSRLVIGRVLNHFLAAKQATPIDLLFGPALQQTLNQQDDLLERAIASVARAQAVVHDSPVQPLAENLRGLCTSLKSERLALAADEALPRLADTKPDLFAERVSEHYGGDDLKMSDAIAFRLSELTLMEETHGQKLAVLTGFLSGARNPTFLSVLDRFVADLVLLPDIMRQIIGDPPSLMLGLEAMAALAHGEHPDPALEVGPHADLLARHIARSEFPETRCALVELMRRNLLDRDRLAQGTLDSDATSTLEFANRIQDLIVVMDGPSLPDALVERLMTSRNLGGATAARQAALDLADAMSNHVARLRFLTLLRDGEHADAVEPVYLEEAVRVLDRADDVKRDMRLVSTMDEGKRMLDDERTLLMRLSVGDEALQRKIRWKFDIIAARFSLQRR